MALDMTPKGRQVNNTCVVISCILLKEVHYINDDLIMAGMALKDGWYISTLSWWICC